MSKTANRVVRFAAALLPARLRERYREQWLGELRDAPELGIPASEIALASLTFAASLDRPFARSRRSTEDLTELRTRAAIGLSLSAALLAITQFATVADPIDYTWKGDFFGFIVFSAAMLLTLYGGLAPLAAVVLAFTTRRASTHARVAVVLLAVASALPPLSRMINNEFMWIGDQYLTPWNAAYPASLALIAVACFVLWNDPALVAASPAPEPPARRLCVSIAAGAGVAMIATFGFVYASSIWTARPVIEWSLPLNLAYRAEFEQWVAIKVLYELFVETALNLGIVAAFLAAAAIAASGLSRRSTPRLSAMLALGALYVWRVYFAAVINLLSITLLGPSVLAALSVVVLAIQWASIVAVIALAVSGRTRGFTTAAGESSTEPFEALEAASNSSSSPMPSMATSGV